LSAKPDEPDELDGEDTMSPESMECARESDGANMSMRSSMDFERRGLVEEGSSGTGLLELNNRWSSSTDKRRRKDLFLEMEGCGEARPLSPCEGAFMQSSKDGEERRRLG